jgi:tetratricopeptide (TPR) repeat protein
VKLAKKSKVRTVAKSSKAAGEKRHKLSLDKPDSVGMPDHHPALRKTLLFPILVVLFFSFAVYFNALYCGFVYDDTDQVLNNPWIRDMGNLPTFFSEGVWGFWMDPAKSNYYRPLMYVTYTLVYHIFGARPWGFHLVNILFHCGAAVLVFLLSRRLLMAYRPSGFSDAFAPPLVAAVLFASHPIHTEAVTWIAGLPDVAFTFFYLLSFYLYIRTETGVSGSYLFSVMCFAVAAFFKEPALTLPIVLLAYDYVFREVRTRFLDYLKRYLPYLIIGAGYLALRIHALGNFAPNKMHVSLSAYQNVINVFPLFAKYLAKLVAPLNLNTFHVLHPISSLFEFKVLISLVATAVFLILIAIALKKNRVVFLSLLFVAAPLLPVLYIPVLAENCFAERYLYLPSVGYVILLAAVLPWIEEKLPNMVRSATVILIVLSGLYAVGTVNRNNIWRNNLILWEDTVNKSPDSQYAHTALGNEYAFRGKLDMALAEYQTALRLKPDYADALVNLGILYRWRGQLDMAIAEYQAALRLKPNYADVHYDLANAYAAKGQWDMAIAEYQTALRLKPNYANAHFNLGVAYLRKGAVDMAKGELEAGLKINPDNQQALRILNSIASK